MSHYVVYDCDVGNDDAWGLMMLVKAADIYKNTNSVSPKKFELLGITCVQGNSNVHQVAENTLRVLDAMDRLDIPVYKGCAHPIIQRHWENPENFHGEDGFGEVQHKSPVDTSLLRPEHAVNVMYDFVCKHPKMVDFILVGPLTNFAMCINMYGMDFIDKIGQVFIMGGNYRAKGNITKCAEFNFMMDPEAALIVLDSVKEPITLLPWETCIDGDLGITLQWRLEVLGAVKSKFMQLLNLVETAIFLPKKVESWMVCDAMCVAAYIFPHLAVKKSRMYHATVELSGKHTRGQVVIDHLKQEKDNVELIMEIDRDQYRKIIAWTAGVEGFDMSGELGNA